MKESKTVVNEAQLKGRRTSLGKKTQEELINIILRKDKTERNNNDKIKYLQTSNLELIKDRDYYKSLMTKFRDNCNIYYDRIENLINIGDKQKAIITKYTEERTRLVNKCNILRRIVFSLLGIMFVLVVLNILIFSFSF